MGQPQQFVAGVVLVARGQPVGADNARQAAHRVVSVAGKGSANALTSFLASLQDQWDSGKRCAATLHRRLQEQGFTGSYGAVYGVVCRLKKGMALTADAISSAVVPARSSLYSVRPVTWLLLRSVDEGAFSPEEEGDLERMLSSQSDLCALRDLAHEFLCLVRQRDGPVLSLWLAAASSSAFAEMKRLASGLSGDLAAVLASLEQPWSIGQVEGQVNRLKNLKRSMYGRGGFGLLRARVLHRVAA